MKQLFPLALVAAFAIPLCAEPAAPETENGDETPEAVDTGEAAAAAEKDAATDYNDKVRVTTYEDGTKVYVNYSNGAFTTEDGAVIPAYGYQVERGSAK